MFGFAWNAKIALDRFPRLSLGAVLSPPGWRTLENMLCGDTASQRENTEFPA